MSRSHLAWRLWEGGGVSEAEVLELPGGRRLGYAEYGRAGGAVFFYFHGHPGSRLEARFAADAAAAAGVRIIALDRPGYGLSHVQPVRRIVDWPADVERVADALGVDRFSVVGSSGGGPYALACAHALPDRIDRVGVISGVGPYDVPGLTSGMRWQNRAGFRVGARFPALARYIMRSMQRNIVQRPQATVAAIAAAMSPVDTEVARRPEVSATLIADIAEAFRAGIQGAASDVVLLGRPWGFDVREVRPAVDLWQGEQDTSCHRRWGATWPRRSRSAGPASCRAKGTSSSSAICKRSSMPCEEETDGRPEDRASPRRHAQAGLAGVHRARRARQLVLAAQV
jgi:pimeloyl-ACP methyl ester carboxylesterase